MHRAACLFCALAVGRCAADDAATPKETRTAQLRSLRNDTKLREELLAGYDQFVAPVGATLKVQMSLQQIVSLDTKEQTVTFNAWWRHYWTDERLAWDPALWGGVSFLMFRGTRGSEQIWSPDTMVYEALDTTVSEETIDFNVWSDGSVFVSKPMVTRVLCPADMTHFPFDTQTCTCGAASPPPSRLPPLVSRSPASPLLSRNLTRSPPFPLPTLPQGSRTARGRTTGT